MSGRWHLYVRTPNKKPTAEQQCQQHKAALLQACQQARHTTTPTLRPGETVCLGCGAVFYCPACFKEQGLFPAKKGRALVCSTHQKAKVQA